MIYRDFASDKLISIDPDADKSQAMFHSGYAEIDSCANLRKGKYVVRLLGEGIMHTGERNGMCHLDGGMLQLLDITI